LTSPSTIGVEDQMERLTLYHVNPMDQCPTKQKTPKEMTYYTLVTMSTPVPPDLNHAIVTTPIPIEVR